ncbi:melanocortin-2 receptor accessory protein 2 [Pelodytes ibericus]
MSEQRVQTNRTSQKPLPHYTWEYEYYEYAPVSFEGLKAHKYSIVIGFWVGLAVFVIFMFFVLTLLTKTGAPHQENIDTSEKRFQMNTFTTEFSRPLQMHRGFSCHEEESRSLFHCYINEVEQQERTKCTKEVEDRDLLIQQTLRNCKTEEELQSLAKFNIPNCVSSDHNSSAEDDDLLSYDPTIIFESKPACSSKHHFSNG